MFRRRGGLAGADLEAIEAPDDPRAPVNVVSMGVLA